MIIKSINMQNFKCYDNKQITFTDTTNMIQGSFGTGKSTIYEAFRYAIDFKVDFEPIDKSTKKRLGCQLEPITTSVEIEIDNNGTSHIIKRQNIQKWKDNKYEKSIPTYFVDGLKCKTANEYHEKIALCLGTNYSLLPLLTNIRYFNEELDKNDRYSLLNSIFNIESSLDQVKKMFPNLTKYFNKGFNETNINDMINQNIKVVENQLTVKKVLMQDKKTALDKCNSIDYAKLTADKDNLIKQIKELEDNLNNTELFKQYQTLVSQRENILVKQLELNNDLLTIRRQIAKAEIEIDRTTQQRDTLKNNLSNLVLTISSIVNAPLKDICECCGQTLPPKLLAKEAVKKEELLKKYSSQLDDIKTNINQCETQLKEFKKTKSSIVKKETTLKKQLETDFDTTDLSKKIAEIQKQLDSPTANSQKLEVNNEIERLKNDLQGIDLELLNENLMDNLIAEIDQLQEEIKQLAMQDRQNTIEKDELFDYKIKKSEKMNEIINSVFNNGIGFIFYQDLSSKAQNSKKLSCECCLNGINYSNLSTGQKIKTNIIINQVLQNYYKSNLPIWIDDYQCFGEKVDSPNQIVLIKTIGNTIDFDNTINI